MPENQEKPLVNRVFGKSGDEVLRIFQDPSIPWTARAYLYLFLFTLFSLVVVFIFSTFRSDSALGDKVISLLGDALKVIIGATVGSLSVATERIFVAKKPVNKLGERSKRKPGEEPREEAVHTA